MPDQENKNAGSSPASQDAFNYGEENRSDTPRTPHEKTTDIDKLAEEAEEETRTKKPGSQSQSNTDRHNNGRGGGK